MAVSTEREISIRLLAETLAKELAETLTQATKCCITCEHFDLPREVCTKYARRPPAKIIAYGCPDYSERPPF